MERLISESLAQIQKDLSVVAKGRDVYLESDRRLCARCVQEVSGGCRESPFTATAVCLCCCLKPFIGVHRARILLTLRAEWRARCVPWSGQTLLPSCVLWAAPRLSRLSFLSSPSPSSRDMGHPTDTSSYLTVLKDWLSINSLLLSLQTLAL